MINKFKTETKELKMSNEFKKKIEMNCKLKYYDTMFDFNIMDVTYPATNNEAVIRVILIEDKKLKRENKFG